MALHPHAVRVTVPATSANLGPAFDCAGLAFDLRDELVAMVTDDPGVLVEVEGEGADEVARDGSHLVVRAMAAGFAALGESPAGLVLRCRNAIPHGRGLGSSAAAIIGGLVLARALTVDGTQRMSDDDLLQVAVTMESHPDNLSAALLGGFTLSWRDDDGVAGAVSLALHPDIEVTLCVPMATLPTKAARAMLPSAVPLADASWNVSRSALLVHALTRDPSLLMEATRDRLHQDARAQAYADSTALMTLLRSSGIPAVISGAGPTVLAFGAVDQVAAPGWSLMRPAISPAGAQVQERPEA